MTLKQAHRSLYTVQGTFTPILGFPRHFAFELGARMRVTGVGTGPANPDQ